MSYPFDTNDMAIPGLESILETVQNQFWWGRAEQQTFAPCLVSGAARDAGNTVTDVLRGGLLLGQITATKKLMEWSPTATDGTEVIYGILPAPLKMTDAGSNADRYTYVYVGGNVLSDNIYIPGEAAEGIVDHASEFLVLGQLQDRGIRLDRHIKYGNANARGARPRLLTTAQAATNNAVSVSKADHGVTFLMTSAGTAADGDVTFTLPAAVKGLVFHFCANIDTHAMVIALASGTLSKPGDYAGTGVTLGEGESATIVGIGAGQYQLFAHEATD